MADLVAGDVTYTIENEDRTAGGKKLINAKLEFGDGADTIPSGGIPLTKANLGCPNIIESLSIYDQSGSGFVYQYDKANEKLLVYNAAATTHTHALHLNNADVTDGTTTTVNAGTNLLGANTGSDIAVAGVANTSGAGGIVQDVEAAAALANSTAAIAAQTIYVQVVGW